MWQSEVVAQVDPPKQQCPPEGAGGGEGGGEGGGVGGGVGGGEGDGVGNGDVDDIAAHLPVKGTPLTLMFEIENLH